MTQHTKFPKPCLWQKFFLPSFAGCSYLAAGGLAVATPFLLVVVLDILVPWRPCWNLDERSNKNWSHKKNNV